MNKIFISILLFFIILFNKVININANDDTYINSSNITYNEKENIVELAENSKINFKNTNILIDKGIIDYNNNEFEVFGNFYLYEDLTILSGENLKGNTSFDVLTADNVSYIYNDDLKIDSDILKRDFNTIYFYNSFLTPCDLEGYFNCPTWSLRIDKTTYDVEKDKFKHFDTFLQIADYKVFYLPYFTHYGAKAPRQKGFLTPTIEFTIGGDQGIIIPYYLPLGQSTDILFKPKITLNPNYEILEKYHLNTFLENRNSGGNITIHMENVKNVNSEDINSSIRIDTKQIINRNSIVSASGIFTNSLSTTRSNNQEPITFENIYLRFENYNFMAPDDYLVTELSSVKSFESTEINSIPIKPSFNYVNFSNLKNFSFMHELDFIIISRDKSSANNPSESFKLNLINELIKKSQASSLYIDNKLLLSNSYNDYYFNNENSLNHNSFKSNIVLSSDLSFNDFDYTTPRAKFIIPLQLENTNKKIVEESESITFNYQNQFSENRFFGNDLSDTSPRLVYALENSLELKDLEISFNINQSYEANLNNTYVNKINQSSKFSDYAIESYVNSENLSFKIDTRLDQEDLSRKEMNYSLIFQRPINASIDYNETQTKAFKNNSNDTQSIILDISKKINENINFSFKSNLDVKNNYDPYKSALGLSLFDECSQLDIIYSNTRFNDNFNTQPEEIISLTFSMDYLGFFGYEQKTDLILSEPGNIKYGL